MARRQQREIQDASEFPLRHGLTYPRGAYDAAPVESEREGGACSIPSAEGLEPKNVRSLTNSSRASAREGCCFN